MALEAVSNASDEESSQSAYNMLLFAVGNNHAGTYYPVVLTTFTDIAEILRSGGTWPQRTVIEALIDLFISFVPASGQEVFRECSLSDVLRERIIGLKPHFAVIACGSDVAAASARDILKHMNQATEHAGAKQPNSSPKFR